MRRLILAFLLIALATALVPPLRERADPHLDRIGTYLGEKLEGPLGPVLNPYRRLRSEAEISQAISQLIRDRNAGFLRPDPADFQEYMRTRIAGEDGLDRWGSPYVLIVEPDSVAVVSAGPDLEYETEDDITVKIRFGTPAYMPTRRR